MFMAVGPEQYEGHEQFNATGALSQREVVYLSDVDRLRKEVYAKVVEVGAMTSDYNALVFDMNFGDGSCAHPVFSRGRARLLLLGVEVGDGTVPPIVRITTNEVVTVGKGKLAQKVMVTEDFIIDKDQDAAFAIDMDLHVPFEQFDEQAATLPVFRFDSETGMFYRGAVLSSPQVPVKDLTTTINGEDEITVYPFGLTDNLEDKEYALDRGRQLFEEIRDQSPMLWT